MPNKRAEKMLILPLDESGVAAVTIALVFAALCGFVALGMDIGHMVMVKVELQRTADAGALAGAAGLVPYNNPGPNQTPNWVNGTLKAQALVNNAANEANNQQFSISADNVKFGYWCLKPPGYEQSPPSPPLPTVCPTDLTLLPEPAITVTLSRDVTLYLAPLIGISSPKTVTASATAILPEANTTTNIIPIAVSYDTAFNNVNGTVVIDTTPNQPITVNSNKNEAGWFTMSENENFPQSVITNPLTAGTDLSATKIYLQPGSEVTLENQLISDGMTLVMPVVDTVTQKTFVPIVAFVAFKIDSTTGPVIKGHFLDTYYDPNVVPTENLGGIITGVGGTPKIVSP